MLIHRDELYFERATDEAGRFREITALHVTLIPRIQMALGVI